MKQNCKRLKSCVSKGIMCLKKQYVTHLAELQYQYHWKDLEAVEKPQHLPTASKALTASPGTLTHRCTQTWDTISSQLWGYRISPNNAVKAPVCSPALVPWIYPPALWFGLPSSVPDFFSFCSQVRSWTWFMLGLLIDPVTCALPLCSVLAWFSPTIIRKWPARSQHWLSDSHPFSPSLLPGTPLLKNLYLYVVWFPLVLDFWRQFLLFCSQLSYLLFCYKQLEIQCFFFTISLK